MAVSSSQKRKFVVLSLGTGVANKTGAYDAREMTGWGLFRWYWYWAHKHFIANQEIVDEHYLKEMAAINVEMSIQASSLPKLCSWMVMISTSKLLIAAISLR
ncbi:hypothetical protein Tco_0950882 [Tanacetum coccineum]